MSTPAHDIATGASEKAQSSYWSFLARRRLLESPTLAAATLGRGRNGPQYFVRGEDAAALETERPRLAPSRAELEELTAEVARLRADLCWLQRQLAGVLEVMHEVQQLLHHEAL